MRKTIREVLMIFVMAFVLQNGRTIRHCMEIKEERSENWEKLTERTRCIDNPEKLSQP